MSRPTWYSRESKKYCNVAHEEQTNKETTVPGTRRPDNTPDRMGRRQGKAPILGQGHSLTDEEGEIIQHMIREEQQSSRLPYIPQEDLSQEATTQMSPATARVIGV